MNINMYMLYAVILPFHSLYLRGQTKVAYTITYFTGMVSKKNLMEIVLKLMSHMAKAEGTTYRLNLNPNLYITNTYIIIMKQNF